MPITSPDEILWRYLQLRQKLNAPPARSTVAETGLVFGKRCKECGAPEREARLEETCKRTGASRFRCDRCQAIWPVDVAFLLRNEFQHTSTSDPGQLYQRVSTFGRVLSRLTIREQRVYLLLYLYEGVGSYAEVAKEMNRRFPRSQPPRGERGVQRGTGAWSEWAVRRTINSARRRIRDELRLRGLML